MDEKLLAQLGLRGVEIAIFSAVLTEGPVTPVVLAKMLGIKRTTAYGLARGLAERGFIREDTSKRPRMFSPASKADLMSLIAEDRKRIQIRESALKAIAEDLEQAARRSQYPIPTLRFVEEAKIGKFMDQQVRIWDASAIARGEPTWWGFQDHTFLEQFGDWTRAYWAHAPAQISLKFLSNRAGSEVRFAATAPARREIKYWGEAALFRSTSWVIGDYVVMVNTRTHPFYLVEIHDELMANDQREVFKNLWPLVDAK